ncbi:NiFe hydrogenase [Shewanella gelidimarina]|uniref:Kae1-like domain-containing protein n=1 Tax=Shewanella gelidimarina TaxID=56813 RepID=UPI00200F0FCA|nr:NiFe hydrogenase [Shewanella gelidimarina]MCL1060066.1 NiFe hydrogenase [Shewanella gelidimarina]
MKNIRFEFDCQREVPFYGHLCNQYLLNDQYDVTIGQTGNRYFIEAKGEQPELEQLADAIAEDFLISSWLIKPNISLIEAPIGNHKLLQHTPLLQEYCQHCQPQFGDNQAGYFGQLDYVCPCCQAEKRVNKQHKAIDLKAVKLLVDSLETQGYVDLPAVDGKQIVQLSYKPNNAIGNSERQKLVICNPNNLNAHFVVTEQQVLALSSIEKPLICSRAIDNHPRLTDPLYSLCFANSRLLLVICELLRQRGVDWIYISRTDNPQLALVDALWVPLKETGHKTYHSDKTPLHDDVHLGQYDVHWVKDHIEVSTLSSPQSTDIELASVQELHEAATCALHAANLGVKKAKNCAVLYLSDTNKSRIVTMDSKQKLELFFEFPTLPDNGYDIVHQIDSSPQKNLFDKFKQQHPEDYLALLELKLTAPTNNIQSLWAIAAILLGAATTNENITLNKVQLSDFIIASAMRHKGSNAPRVDFPLTRGEAFRSLNWCKTLGSIISFRLAEDGNIEKLAFGMHDSLADFICNWIEHLDQNISIKSVALAGSSFNNELLGKRISLRLGKNFTLNPNQQMDLEGVNIAVGSLFLKQRRH